MFYEGRIVGVKGLLIFVQTYQKFLQPKYFGYLLFQNNVKVLNINMA
jgi:hypothetical protein